MEPERKKIKTIVDCCLLLLAGALLFALSNPNIIFSQGLGFLAWFMYIPFLFIIKKTSAKSCWFFSGLYGTFCVGLYAYWLYNYNSLCFYIALIISFIAIALVGLVMKGLEALFKQYAWLLQFLFLISFEYLRTLGFLGFHYGLAAYTQWNFNTLIQALDLGGVFLLNSLIIFSSVLIYTFISKLSDRKEIEKRMISDNELYKGVSYVNYVSENTKNLEKTSLKLPFAFLALWCALFIFLIVYGRIKINQGRQESYKYLTVAAIQHNDDPDANDLENYSESLSRLVKLTEEALEINPDIDLVVWPETAVVPSVILNYYKDENTSKRKLITYLLEYINSNKSDFLIGNQHIINNAKTGQKKIYNAALLFSPKKNVLPPDPQINLKNSLVPFSEYFPYEKAFPHIYKSLLEYEGFFWDPGEDISILESCGLSIYSPICFENTFPDLCRKAYKKGARSLFCLVNDSWSKSLACQYQHLAMAKFRALENRIPALVSSVSGQSVIINQNGMITAAALPFTQTYIIGQVPIIPEDRKATLYNTIGELFGKLPLFLFIILLIIRVIIVIISGIKCQNAQNQKKRI